MTIRQKLTALLISEIQEAAELLKEGKFEQFRKLREEQHKFVDLLESTCFVEELTEDKDKIEQEEIKTELLSPFSLESYTGPLLDFFKKRNKELVVKFIESELELYELKEERFHTFIEKKAIFNKSGIALNDTALGLQEFRNLAREKEEVLVEKDKITNLPVKSELKNVGPINIKVVKRASEGKKESEPKILVEGAFHKNVTGGSVKDHPISEMIMRHMGLEEGEVLRVIDSPSGACPYTVERTGKKEKIKPSTLQSFTFGIVEKDEQERLFIQRNINGELLDDKTNQSKFYLSSKTIARHSLGEGELVELRWFKNSPESMNVSWVYKQEELTPVQQTERTRLIKKAKVHLNPAPIQNYAFDLQGLKVLIVGGEPFWPNWKQVIEANNGELSTYDSKNKKPKREIYEARIAKSDVVLFCQNMLSHGTYYMGKAISKKYNVPFSNFTSYGIGNIFETLKKMKEQERVLQAKEESEELDYEKFLSWTNHMIKEVFREEEGTRKKEMLSDWTASYNKNKGHFNREQRRTLSKLYSSMEKFSGTIK